MFVSGTRKITQDLFLAHDFLLVGQVKGELYRYQWTSGSCMNEINP
jgi:hypothetical protein